MLIPFQFVAVNPEIALVCGTLRIGTHASGRPALDCLDERDRLVIRASVDLDGGNVPSNALVIRQDAAAAGILEQLAEADHVIDLEQDVYDANGKGGRLVLPVGALAEAIAHALRLRNGVGLALQRRA